MAVLERVLAIPELDPTYNQMGISGKSNGKMVDTKGKKSMSKGDKKMSDNEDEEDEEDDDDENEEDDKPVSKSAKMKKLRDLIGKGKKSGKEKVSTGSSKNDY